MQLALYLRNLVEMFQYKDTHGMMLEHYKGYIYHYEVNSQYLLNKPPLEIVLKHKARLVSDRFDMSYIMSFHEKQYIKNSSNYLSLITPERQYINLNMH